MSARDFSGKENDAYKNLYQATWSYAFHSAAYFQLAQIDCKLGNYDLALDHLDRSLATNSGNIKARNLKSAILRRLVQHALAMEISSTTSAFDRLDFGSRFEFYLANASLGNGQESEKCLQDLKGKMRDYLQSYLELSLDYANAGLLEEAIDVLDNPGLHGTWSGDHSPLRTIILAISGTQWVMSRKQRNTSAKPRRNLLIIASRSDSRRLKSWRQP